MAGGKRDRQKASRQARLARAAAARRRARRRRLAVAVGAVALVVVATVLFLSARDGGKGAKTASPSTTSAPAAGSAAGKPCVAVSDPLPPGAPAVPVKVGPPPAQLVSEDLKAGTGPPVAAGATVTVNYVGVSCSTGKVFDSSYSRNQPATFPLRGVIQGWQQGIPGMHVGGQRLLGIPSAQAYGASGRPPTIAPDEALWFVIEVLEAKP